MRLWRWFSLCRLVIRQRRRIQELEQALQPFAAMTSDHGSLINLCQAAHKTLRSGRWR